MLIAIVAISYILAINVFGFRIVKIQRADRAKNGEPTPQPKIAQLSPPKSETQTAESKKEVKKESLEKEKTKELTACKKETSKQKRKSHQTQQEQKPHNGDKLEKDTLLAEEKLNFKRYEKIPDLKILMVALFGGALGEYIAFLVLKYRTTNTLLMVALPVLISLWLYLYYIIVAGVFIV